MRLWDAPGTTVDEAVLAFTVGEDPSLDRELLPHDCLASAAHATMLREAGLLTAEEHAQLDAALREAYALACAGDLPITVDQEDGHTALETFLVARAGEAGFRIHTGRSRNDQVIQALRLLVRERLLDLAATATSLGAELTSLHRRHARTLMPGYTHTRQAMPSTVGQLFAASAEGLARDIADFALPLAAANRAALGSASGYGAPLPLRRERIAELLGLDGVDGNTLYVQNTRGRLESAALFALHQTALTTARLATDLLTWSAEAFGFFRLPVALTTGSSLMPQKRNPDVLELIRAVPASMLARYVEVTAALHGLGAGYHRDLQRSKGPLLGGLAESERVLLLLDAVVRDLEVDAEACRGALDPAIFATDHVCRLVQEGVPFRTAYQTVKNEPPRELDPTEVLARREHLGAPGTDQSSFLEEIWAATKAGLEPYRIGVTTARRLLG